MKSFHFHYYSPTNLSQIPPTLASLGYKLLHCQQELAASISVDDQKDLWAKVIQASSQIHIHIGYFACEEAPSKG
jgi:hypothetical protein